MSLETLLEAAMFLEWQAQQQNRARDDNEKLLLERQDEDDREKKVIVKIEIPDVCPDLPIDLPNAAPPLPSPPSLVPPVTVIPLPVVASMPVQTVHPSLSTPLVHCHAPVVSSSNIGKEVPIAPINQRSCGPAHSDLKKNVSMGNPELIHQYPAPVLAISQPHVVQSLQPQPQQTLQQQPVPSSPQGAFRITAGEDMKTNEQKRRPGGRAHLKECFETLKRNIPNVDDKKTSNLSVLRSALRYIQTLKRKEKEYEHEMERLAREKIATQHRLEELKNELSQWMDVLEIERIIRQTVQPEDDQASTSTASEGEDNIDDDVDGDRTINLLPKLAHRQHSELLKGVPLGIPSTLPTVLPGHLSINQKHMLSNPTPHIAAQTLVSAQSISPTQTHLVAASTVQSTVIAHTATTHASVIQTLNHILPRHQAKHITHIAPSTASSVPISAAPTQPISHITVHPARINHMGQQLPTIYPQPVAVSQPMVSHMTHGMSHTQVNGTSNLSQQTVIAKPAVGTQVVHQQLVGQTVLNPVTMVTMPSFPVSTLKLA